MLKTHYTLFLLAWLMALSLSAQVKIGQPPFTIDGRKAFYDSLTNTLLVSIPRSSFDSGQMDGRVRLSKEWDDVSIDGQKANGKTISFAGIAPGKSFQVALSPHNGSTINTKLTFTYLPVIQLNGSFGYGYQEGSIEFVDPDSNHTMILPASIKWRGSTTNTDQKHKRNYRVKLNENVRLLNLRNDNNWLLDAGQSDLFRMRNLVANNLWNSFATKPYYADQEPEASSATHGRMTELFLGNKYQGVYNLMENMDREQMKLKKFDEQTGEIHGALWKAKGYGCSLMYNVGQPYDNHSATWDTFEAEYPDLADLDSIDWSTLYNAIYFVAKSNTNVFRQRVEEFFDVPVLLDYYLFINLLSAVDNRGKNMVWAVYDKAQSKRLTPAVWDLDRTVGYTLFDYSSPEYDMTVGFNLYVRLKNLNPDGFNQRLEQRYAELRATVFDEHHLHKLYTDAYELLRDCGATEREQQRWSGDSDIKGEPLDLKGELDYIKQWITQRLYYLDTRVFPKVMGISQTMADTNHNNQRLYNLSGQRLDDKQQLKPGIYISNNRKILVR